MIKLTSKHGVVSLRSDLDDNRIQLLSYDDLETLQYAVYSFSYVNNHLGATWEVDINQWIRNISDVFDLNTLHVKRVINVLNKLI